MKKSEGLEKKKKDEAEEQDRGGFDIHALTYGVPIRQKNLQYCFICGEKKATKECKKEPLPDKNEDEKEKTKSDEDVNEKQENGEEEKIVVNEEEDQFIRCSFPKCPQRMHKNCADQFICSEYSPSQAQLLFNLDGPICPAHFCWHCYSERKKNSSRFGELIDCEKCVRSFHLECLPAGCKTISSSDKKRKTFICHEHSPAGPKLITRMRLKYCCDCEVLFEDDESLKEDPNWETNDNRKMECKKCCNVFHRGCAFKKVKGIGAEDYAHDTCAYCLIGQVIVANQYVLAYDASKLNGLNIGYYPAVAMAIKDIPSKVVKKLGAKFGKPGYIPVKWLWNSSEMPFFNVVHKSLVQGMTISCKKNICEKDWKEELKLAELNFKAPVRALDDEEMRKTIIPIVENVYSKDVPRILKNEKIDQCECRPDANGIKCNTSDCPIRQTHSECTKLCDEDENVLCANRAMQGDAKKRSTELYEVKTTTNGKGLGVFATRTIKPLEFIFEYAGEVISKEEHDRRELRISKLRSNDEYTYMMGLTGNFLVDARFKGSDARYVNHSCNPNCEVNSIDVPMMTIKNNRTQYEPKLKVEALREIQKGEELTFNYGLAKSRGLALDVCLCGAKNCIGKIGKKKNENDSDDDRFDDKEQFDEEDLSDSDSEDDVKENKKRKKKVLKKKIVEKKVKKEEPKVMATNKRRASLGGPSGSRDRVPTKKNK